MGHTSQCDGVHAYSRRQTQRDTVGGLLGRADVPRRHRVEYSPHVE